MSIKKLFYYFKNKLLLKQINDFRSHQVKDIGKILNSISWTSWKSQIKARLPDTNFNKIQFYILHQRFTKPFGPEKEWKWGWNSVERRQATVETADMKAPTLLVLSSFIKTLRHFYKLVLNKVFSSLTDCF